MLGGWCRNPAGNDGGMDQGNSSGGDRGHLRGAEETCGLKSLIEDL